MKTTIIGLTIIFAACFSMQSQAQKTTLNTGEVPKQITHYIEQNFSEQHVQKAYRNVDEGKTEYEIMLNNRIELEFDEDFQIKEIDSKNGFSSQLLPSNIAEYLHVNYPKDTVTEWKRTKKGQEVELNNKIELEFDLNGNFLKRD